MEVKFVFANHYSKESYFSTGVLRSCARAVVSTEYLQRGPLLSSRW
jgi:hypothetical protein